MYFLFFKINWSDGAAVFSIVFLTIISGWLAAVIVDYMYKEVGECCLKKKIFFIDLLNYVAHTCTCLG